jgi:hypothetical protein
MTGGPCVFIGINRAGQAADARSAAEQTDAFHLPDRWFSPDTL